MYDEGKIKCSRTCNPPCNEIIYDTDVQMSYLPSYDTQNYPLDYMEILIHFKTLDTIVWEDNDYYKLENLLGDIGGQFGLYNGWSVTTVVEFIILLFTIMKITTMNIRNRFVRRR